jgi:hypothetical protein
MRPAPFPALLSLLASVFPLSSDAYTPLSTSLLKSLPQPKTTDYDPSTGSLLAPLLIPRVPGTEGQLLAQAHLANFFRTHLPQWELIWQNSTSTTPATGDKRIPFANLILRREPPWTKSRGPGEAGFLTLVAHYDSKREPEGFVGATDSAAPCAVLMDVARAIEGYLVRKWKQEEEEAKKNGKETSAKGLLSWQGVQILFLDGEEAFVSWTDTDSLYGSRWDLSIHFHFAGLLVSLTVFLHSEPLQKSGSHRYTQQCRHSRTHCSKSACLCCLTCSARSTRGYRRTSRTRIGRTRRWP